MSVYQIALPVGKVGLAIFGSFAGVFVGAWSMALTEIVNIIPIFTRRITLRRGMELIIFSMAIGRSLGSLLFFIQRW